MLLEPYGRASASTVAGFSEVERYLVNFALPDGMTVSNLRVTKGLLSGFDVVAGMDVISLGDFAVSNFGGVTKFSFRVPSLSHIDFVEEAGRQA